MTNHKLTTIDFSELGGPVFIGRPRGRDARKVMNLDELDTIEGSINVLIPDDTYALNSSYFLEMFGKSILRCET